MSEDVRVVLVRHAETEWSLAQRHTGRTDIPLTEAGRDAARELAPRLAGYRFSRVFVSPLRRARETCELSGHAANAEIREDLSEWDYGDYEGLTSEQVRSERPHWSLWRDGCPGGEQPADVAARADRVIAELSALDGTVAVFSHGHMLRVLGCRWVALGPGDGGRLGLWPAGVCLLSHERGTRIIEHWNDTGA